MNLKTIRENLVLLTGLLAAVAVSFCQDPVQEPAESNQPEEKNASPDISASERDRPNRENRKEKSRRDRTDRESRDGSKGLTKNNEPLTSQQQEEIETFVRENLPELGKVLRALREKRPQQYQRAIHSIQESYVRLQNIKSSGNEQGYTIALENWKTDARIKMTSAQLTIKNNPALQSRLEALVAGQAEQRLSQLKSDRDRLQKRLERLDSSIADFENRKEGEIKRRVAAIIRSTEQARKEYQTKASGEGNKDRSDMTSETESSQPEKKNRKEKNQNNSSDSSENSNQTN